MPGIQRERPGAEAIAAASGAPAIDLGDDIFMSPGLSNSYMLRDDDGRIIVNAGMGFQGPRHRAAFDAVGPAPTRAVVFTQGHYDHVGGVDCLREEDTEVIAHANFGTWRDDNKRLEAFRVRNAAFAWMDAIAAARSHARECTPGCHHPGPPGSDQDVSRPDGSPDRGAGDGAPVHAGRRDDRRPGRLAPRLQDAASAAISSDHCSATCPTW